MDKVPVALAMVVQSAENPLGLAMDSVLEELWVCCAHEVLVLDIKKTVENPKVLHRLGNMEKKRWRKKTSVEFNEASGICVDVVSRRVYVADRFHNRIVVFNADTKAFLDVITALPSEGKRIPIIEPCGLVVDRQGKLFISDRSRGRILVCDVEDIGNPKLVRLMGENHLSTRPYGVCVDGNGRVIVADRDAAQVLVFSAFGERELILGGKGTRPGEFDEGVWGVIVSRDGFLIVSDQGNCRVQVFLE